MADDQAEVVDKAFGGEFSRHDSWDPDLKPREGFRLMRAFRRIRDRRARDAVIALAERLQAESSAMDG